MTFSRVRTFIIALVVGGVVTLAVEFGFGSIQAALFPPPLGAGGGDTAAAAATPLVAKLLLLAEWAVTDLVAIGAAILANDGRKGIAWAAWLYPLVATVANYGEHAYPNWLMIAGALACPLTAVVAYQLSQAYERRRPSGAAKPSAGAVRSRPRPYVINACWLGALALVFPAVWFLWLPPDAQFGALILKGLLLLVLGYAALMNLASLIGYGVGWIADPSTARDDSLQANGDRRFRVSRWRDAALALGCAGIVALFIWLSATASPVFVIGAVTFALWTFFFGMQAVSPSWLTLSAAGFQTKHWSGPADLVAWTDIEPVYLWGAGRAGFVCYRFLEGRLPSRLHWSGRYYRRMGVCDGRVPDGLPLAPEPLCALMNQMRVRAGGPPEAAVSPPPASPALAPERRLLGSPPTGGIDP
jgi:hypothetical protein